MPVRRHFLPWARPLLPQAVEFLAGGWEGGTALDLSRMLVVVPTRQAGRRLREGLAAHAAGKGSAVFPPKVVTPEALVAVGPEEGAATRLESLLGWAAVLREVDLEEFREVFGVDPAARDLPWAMRVAERLAAVGAELAEGGLRMRDAAERVGEDWPEFERWRQLGELERRYDGKLGEKGLRDGNAVKIEVGGGEPGETAPGRSPQRADGAPKARPEGTPPAGALQGSGGTSRLPPAFEGIDRVVVAGTPDPMPLSVRALEGAARMMPVEVLVFAPAEEEAAFDEWGRPKAEAWGLRVLELPDFEERVRLCADPAEQAEEIAELAKGYGRPEGRLAVGLADAEVAPVLESALRRVGIEAFDPEGRLRRQGELHPLLTALRDLARAAAFEAVEDLGRSPAFLEFLHGRSGGSFSVRRWLEGLDEARRRHLPSDLDSAMERAGGLKRFPELGAGLEAMGRLRETLKGGFAKGAVEAPAAIFEGRRLDLDREADARLAEEARDWGDAARECASAAEKWGGMASDDCWEAALRLFGEKRAVEDKPEGAVELQGWLELLWEDAPHLAVAGMNEGCVPEAVTGDAFLPESLREKLGLKANGARFARDAYLLQALAFSRRAGRLDLLLGKTSVEGEPLKPSRLLFQCADGDLPGRVGMLFRELESAREHLAWRGAWKLAPPKPAPQARVAVTALRDWLKCPFRFYLRHVLGMAPVDVGKGELDEMDFGTLCHAVLEAMGRNERWKDCRDAAALRGYVSEELDRKVAATFGGNLALPLVVQRDAARQRLGRAAEVQARERADGWRIVEVEKRIDCDIGGLVVSGKVDRVDLNERTGEVRVLDYKTSDAPKDPAAAHLRSLSRRGEVARDWATVETGGRKRAWSDLQLPFYRIGLAREYPRLTVGYFNLPKAIGDTGLRLWEDYSEQLHASAVRCAEGVCAAIRSGDFWPPAEGLEPDGDAFAAIFHRGVAAGVAWRAARDSGAGGGSRP